MKKLLTILWNQTIETSLELEKSDFQYKSLEKLFLNLNNNELFQWLIISNCIVCYQLSSTWEKYWEEFSKKSIDFFENLKNHPTHIYKRGQEIVDFFIDFLPNSLWNKRFVDTKINRLKKLLPFLDQYIKNNDYYNNNLIIFRDELAKSMKQEKTAKTIVFAVKMLLYWISIINWWKNKICPFEIEIPIDSRLTQIFEKYKEDYTDIRLFYNDLSKKLDIPPIHLDAILWINSSKLI